MSKIELPSDSKVREKILAAIPMAGDTLIGAIYARAGQLGLKLEGGSYDEIGAVIEQDRPMLHDKLDELLDIAADRDRLHQILDVAVSAAIEGVTNAFSDCADSAAASDASTEQAVAVDYCQCCGQLFPILDPEDYPPAAETKPVP